MTRYSYRLMIVPFIASCSVAVSAAGQSSDSQAWKKDAENHIARVKALATTTMFGSINVTIPKSFRAWMPVNESARALSDPQGARSRPPPPPGEVPVFIQFTRLGIKGLNVSESVVPHTWAANEGSPAYMKELTSHWLFSELLSVEQFRASFTLRLGDERGLLPPPRIDLEVRLQDARIPVDIHALQKTCLQSNPTSRGGEFMPGRLTLESSDIPLPSKMQRWLSESFMEQFGEAIVTGLPNQLFGLPTLEQVLGVEPGEAGTPPGGQDDPGKASTRQRSRRRSRG